MTAPAMNVLHVHSGNIFGGVERMLETLAPATAGVGPICSSFALCFEAPLGETLRGAGARIYPLGHVHVRRIDEIWRARRALRQVLAVPGWTAAFVHSAWAQAIFGPVILRSGTPLVRWLHAPDAGPGWLEAWSRRSSPALVLCNSRYTRDGVGSRFGAVPLSVQYPPAAPERRDDGVRTQVRQSTGTLPDTVTIVIAARMEEWKGHELLIESLSLLKAGTWEVWIAGGPQQLSERRYFESLVDKVRVAGLSSRVRFLGQRSDVRRLLRAADIYCQPNAGAEPFGLSFVEALAAGLPVVTTRLGAAPEIVDSTCGLLVEPGSPSALAAALRRLIDFPHERQALSAGAHVRARGFCDLSGSLARLASEISRALPSTAALP